MVFGEYYKDKGQFVQLNKMTLDQIELELQNILNADIGEVHCGQYTGDPGGPEGETKLHVYGSAEDEIQRLLDRGAEGRQDTAGSHRS